MIQVFFNMMAMVHLLILCMMTEDNIPLTKFLSREKAKKKVKIPGL